MGFSTFYPGTAIYILPLVLKKKVRDEQFLWHLHVEARLRTKILANSIIITCSQHESFSVTAPHVGLLDQHDEDGIDYYDRADDHDDVRDPRRNILHRVQ